MGTFYHVPHIMYLQSCSSLGIALLQKSNSFWRMGLWGALKARVSRSLISLEILISGHKSSSGRRRTCKTQRRHAEPLLPEKIHTRNGFSPNPTLQYWEKCDYKQLEQSQMPSTTSQLLFPKSLTRHQCVGAAAPAAPCLSGIQPPAKRQRAQEIQRAWYALASL